MKPAGKLPSTGAANFTAVPFGPCAIGASDAASHARGGTATLSRFVRIFTRTFVSVLVVKTARSTIVSVPSADPRMALALVRAVP